MLSNPLSMALNLGVSLDALKGRKAFSKSHFVVVIVNAIVTKTTDPDALIQLSLRVGFLKAGAAMQLFGNQVMEGQL